MTALTLLRWLDWTVIAVSLPTTFYFVFTILRCVSLHPNLRSFLNINILPLFGVSFTRLVGELSDVYGFAAPQSAYCRAFSVANVLTTGLGDCIMLAIVTERTVATYNRNHYEGQHSHMAVVYMVAMLVYAAAYYSALHYMTGLVKVTFPEQCLLLDRYAILDAAGFSMCGVFSVLCAPFVVYLYSLNRRILGNLDRMGSLSSRYQCMESVVVLRCLFPVFVVCFGVYGSVGLGTILYAAYLSLQDGADQYVIRIFARVSHINVDLVCPTLCVIFFVCHPVLRRRALADFYALFPNLCAKIGDFVAERQRKIAKMGGTTQQYFENLQNQWS